MQSLQIFNRSILQKQSIIIVGNAGITFEDIRAIRQRRDSSDLIRFNNYATRKDIPYTSPPEDCDILFTTFDLHSSQAKPRDVVAGIPFPFQARRNKQFIEERYPNANPWMVDPFKNLEMNDELKTGSDGYAHPFPSIGFTALWHMKDWDCEFYICGFNWYYNNGKFQGWDMKNKNYPTHWNHNYPREIIWIHDNLLGKLNIKFSPSCEQLIKLAKKLSL